MNINDSDRQKKNKRANPLSTILVIAFLVIPLIADNVGGLRLRDTRWIPYAAGLVVLLVLAAVLVGIRKLRPQQSSARGAGSTAQAGAAVRAGGKGLAADMTRLETTQIFKRHETVEPALSPWDRQARYDPAAGMERDKLRRQAQLDSFLRNGIIDRREYAVLMARYEREYQQL